MAKNMTSREKLTYEGYTLPKPTIKELLARNARKDSELKTLHKRLDKEKEELESDFSKTRSQFLSRVHNLLLEGQTHDLGFNHESNSDKEQHSTFESGAKNDNGINDLTPSWEANLKSLSSSQLDEDINRTGCNRNSRHIQPWAQKVEHYNHSLATKAESGSSKLSRSRRKVSWGGRANVIPEDWDARSVLSKSNSEGNLPSAQVICPVSDTLRSRIRRHSVVGRSRFDTFNPRSNSLMKEDLKNQKSSNTPRQVKQRRHTVCARGIFEPKLTSTEEEKCKAKKPLSELLPPITLPPIYLQESKGKETGKKKSFVKTHVRPKAADSTQLKEDLDYCRYLRLNRKDGDYS